MAKNLDWFQARALAQAGSNIRREAWRRWLWFSARTYLWFIYTPQSADVAEETHVVINVDFTDFEFLATDWTDEPWDPTAAAGSEGSGSGDGSTVGATTTTAAGSGGGIGASGGGWGGIGNPGGGNGGGGSGAGGNGSGGGNPPPRPKPASAEYTPLVAVTLDPDAIDGPGCFLTVPSKGTVYVSVTLPAPAGGALAVALISVTCFGQTQLGTLGPGANQDFEFSGSINPGGTITTTATASDGNGHTWTGAGCVTFPAICPIGSSGAGGGGGLL